MQVSILQKHETYWIHCSSLTIPEMAKIKSLIWICPSLDANVNVPDVQVHCYWLKALVWGGEANMYCSSVSGAGLCLPGPALAGTMWHSEELHNNFAAPRSQSICWWFTARQWGTPVLEIFCSCKGLNVMDCSLLLESSRSPPIKLQKTIQYTLTF